MVILIIVVSINVLLMVLAATLVALYFHGLSGMIERKAGIPRPWSMVTSIAGTLILLFLMFWLIGSRVQSQVQELGSLLPGMAGQAKSALEQSAIGGKILEAFSAGDGGGGKLASSVKRLFSSTFGLLGDLYIILFLGAFLTANPGVYKEGIIALVPPSGKSESRKTLNLLGHNLLNWLKGKIFSMAVVAGLTAGGLSIIGIPMVFALSIIAGVLNFVPNFGPLLAMIPAVLVGFTQGGSTALAVAALYIFIQVLESNLITPMVQKKLVHIPPAMIILGQLAVGARTGYLGIILATPIVLIIMTLVKELYVKKQKP
ncbi:MAG TPA: AI-2E family transporter [Sphingobacteriaceae bacterium]